jgi:hypothetical protein
VWQAPPPPINARAKARAASRRLPPALAPERGSEGASRAGGGGARAAPGGGGRLGCVCCTGTPPPELPTPAQAGGLFTPM